MIPTTLVIDGNNYARIVFETDTTGFAIQRLFANVAHNNRPTIVVFDGANAKAARRAIFPGYKVGRPSASDHFYRVMDFWKELLMHTHAMQICIPGFEGDDVIHYLAHNTVHPIEIDSTDGDFCAFLSERVTQPKAPKLKEIQAQDVRLYKALVGDGSDKIPGLKGFGPGAWASLTDATKVEIIKFLNGDQQWTNPLSQKSCNVWAANNQELLRSFWIVAGFLPIPSELITKHLVMGKPDHSMALSKLEHIHQAPAVTDSCHELFKNFRTM